MWSETAAGYYWVSVKDQGQFRLFVKYGKNYIGKNMVTKVEKHCTRYQNEKDMYLKGCVRHSSTFLETRCFCFFCLQLRPFLILMFLFRMTFLVPALATKLFQKLFRNKRTLFEFCIMQLQS